MLNNTIMKGLWFLSVFLFLTIPAHGAVGNLNKNSVDKKPGAHVTKNLRNVSLHFEINKGQTDGQVKFLSRGPGYGLFLAGDEAVLSFKASRKGAASVVRMKLVGANPEPKIVGEEKLASISNYFIGNDSSKWRTNVPNYGKVRYQEVYPGIDLIYYGNQQQLAYDFIVQPGADPKAIRLSYDGIDGYHIDSGNLVLETKSGEEVVFKAPVIYQEIDGQRVNVPGNFIFLDDQQVSFYLKEYDPSLPLIIDPVLEFSTYLGGSQSESLFSVSPKIAVDSNQNIYLIGNTLSSDFPLASPLQSSFDSKFGDIFVSKLSSDGSQLIYSTFLGSFGTEFGGDITVDSQGNAYITGSTLSSSFPTTPNAISSTVNGRPAFVSKLNSTGSVLLYSTLIPMSGDASRTGQAIAVDDFGKAYITGRTVATDLPTTPNAAQPNKAAGSALNFDAFLVTLSSDGSSILYATYLGGDENDQAFGVTVDNNGNAYVTGQTASGNFPTSSGSFQSNFGGGNNDGFITKINTLATTGADSLVYSTYIGGTGDDRAFGIAIDTLGNSYVAGGTTSINFPNIPGLIRPSPSPNNFSDAFIAKLSPNGSQLIYSTFIGGGSPDAARDIALDNQGNAYITGDGGLSNEFPIVDPIFPFSSSVGSGFITKIDQTASMVLFSTFISDGGINQAGDIALDSQGNIYIVGFAGDNFPVTSNVVQPIFGGVVDIFVMKILGSDVQVVANAGLDQSVDEGVTVNLDGTGSSPDPNTLNYDWSQVGGPSVTLTGANTSTPSFDAPYVSENQTLTFELIVDDGTNFSEADSVDIVVVSVNNPPVADAGDDETIKPGAVATLDGSNSFDPESDPTITYQWTQVAGTGVTLSDDTAQQPTFTAPNMVGDVLVFKLQVSDGKESSTPSAGADSSQADTVAVTIVVNSQPVADAGPDQTKDEGSLVTLDGTASFDSDGGDTISFQWIQPGGPIATLSATTSSGPTFTAPAVGPGGEDITFRLVVTDNDPVNPLASLPDDVTIHVSNINDPPSCYLAVANPDKLWPPNHKMKPVDIDGVMDTDVEFNDVTLQITTVTQDEPVNGLGDGDTSPDAVIQVSDPRDS
ncbi:MAG: SBBP repeat-containing protein, partial [Nitrospinae bacterium]|nr:SBBP repeat-containing protein [Nitrospinota bacterium]